MITFHHVNKRGSVNKGNKEHDYAVDPETACRFYKESRGETCRQLRQGRGRTCRQLRHRRQNLDRWKSQHSSRPDDL